MRRSTELLAGGALALAGLLAGTGVSAQALQQGQNPGATAVTPPSVVAPEDVPPGQASPGGIQGQNIFDVKPEVKRDAPADPGYLQQSNGERNRVQPGNNSPMWRRVYSGNEGYSSLPKSEAPEAGVLIQAPVRYPGSLFTTAGEAWRQVRNNWIIPYGGWLFLGVLAALAIFFFIKGPMGKSTNENGGPIERFTPAERMIHWTNAIAFVVLAISGLTMAFGQFFLRPIIGANLFGFLTYVLKTLHNFAGPIFAISLLVIFFTFIRDNLPQRGDLQWLSSVTIHRGKREAPSHRFNPGEKGVFWFGVFLLGAIVIASGLVMDKLIPNLTYDRQTMQMAHMVHSVATVLMMCVFLGHIYMGTVGMRGAYRAMRDGYVSEDWAEEHHAYWYEDLREGKIPAQRSKPLTPPATEETVRPA